MLKLKENMAVELREGMRGGKGTVEITHIFKQEEFTGKIRLCARITIPPGGSIGFHNHEQEEEVFYFISGRGKVDDEGTIKEVGPGDAMLTGGGSGHAVENTGSEPLVFLAIIILSA